MIFELEVIGTYVSESTINCLCMPNEEHHQQVKPWIKTSLAPGSGVVTKYLQNRYL